MYVVGLRLKPQKYQLVKQEVKNLGYVVSHSEISADANKVTAVQHYPRSHTVKQLCSFLRLASYNRPFIPHLS